MNARNKKYFSYKLKFQRQDYRNKEVSFNNRLTALDQQRPYNALEDPHASYYFVSSSVRNHLKSIKRAAINQTTNSIEKEKLKKLLNQKIKPKNQNLSKTPAFFNLNQLITSQALRKASIRTVHSQRKKIAEKTVERKNEEDEERTTELEKRHNKRSNLKKRQFGHLSQQFNKSAISNEAQLHPKADQAYLNCEDETVSQKRQPFPQQYTAKEKNHLTLNNQKDLTLKMNQQPNINKDKQTQDKRSKTIRQQVSREERDRTIKEELHHKKHQNFMSFIEERKRLILQAREKSFELPQAL